MIVLDLAPAASRITFSVTIYCDLHYTHRMEAFHPRHSPLARHRFVGHSEPSACAVAHSPYCFITFNPILKPTYGSVSRVEPPPPSLRQYNGGHFPQRVFPTLPAVNDRPVRQADNEAPAGWPGPIAASATVIPVSTYGAALLSLPDSPCQYALLICMLLAMTRL